MTPTTKPCPPAPASPQALRPARLLHLFAATVLALALPFHAAPAAAQAAPDTLTFTNGAYQGETRDGKPHGRGVLRLTSGDTYDGQYLDGLRHGRGVLTLRNGDRYEGDFVRDALTGKGRWTFANGDRYEGELLNGVFHGRGAMAWANGTRYEGQWVRGEQNGLGVFRAPGGERYEGAWVRNQRQGRGVQTFPDGSGYQGDWVQGKRVGRGVSATANGQRYEGEFANDQPHGRGVFTWPGGDRYEGEFRSGVRDGQGTFVHADGTRYEGGWKSDGRHGRAKVTYPDGSQREGDWTNDRQVAELPPPASVTARSPSAQAGATGGTPVASAPPAGQGAAGTGGGAAALSRAAAPQGPGGTAAARPSGPPLFGALAIDRVDGFHFGWSADHPSREAAEQRAMEEARKRGARDASVVLSWSGAGCGAYRTIDGKVGTAYGWGLAPTREEADRIATTEALKRSAGNLPRNHVWGCNSSDHPMQVLYDAGPEIFAAVRIGTQVWAATNLQVTHFRNGDPIPEAKSPEDFQRYNREKQAAYFCYTAQTCAEGGRMYNGYAVIDPRGLAPKGWRIPSRQDWATLIQFLGGKNAAGPKMRKGAGWPSWAVPANNASAFHSISGQRFVGSRDYWDKERRDYAAFFWTSSVLEPGRFHHHVIHRAYDSNDEVHIGNQGYHDGLPVRLIKD